MANDRIYKAAVHSVILSQKSKNTLAGVFCFKLGCFYELEHLRTALAAYSGHCVTGLATLTL